MTTTDTTSPSTIPVTVLTGYLGAGKTTLLNHLLTANHGRRIAIIENEFGEIGIDHELVIRAEEEIFEMSNGCICCTVRGDLLRILGNLQKRRDRFDHILIETTGMADPGPVAQTFFTDPDTRDHYRLDGIVTVVDAKHLVLHLDTSEEAQAQIAFADVILLNKTDLVAADELDRLEARIRAMNALATVHRTQQAIIDPGPLLDIGGFDLERAQRIRPNFLEPEYPFEWAGIHQLPAGHTTISVMPTADSHVDLVMINADSMDFRSAVDLAARAFAEPAEDLKHGQSFVPGCRRMRLQFTGSGRQAITALVPQVGSWLIASEHGAEELSLEVLVAGDPIHAEEARELGGHTHESAVSSVGIEESVRELDAERFNHWIFKLLEQKGTDLYRYKGILALANESSQIVLQGVHMLVGIQRGQPWSGPRSSRLIFIGRNLDRAALLSGFQSCLV